MPILGGVFLFVVIAIFLLVIAWEVINFESGWYATVTAAVGLGVVWWFTGAVNFVPYIAANWGTILICIAAYLGAGVVWAIIEWWMLLHEKADEYQAQRTELQTTWDNGYNVKYAGSYKEWIASRGFPPSISNHKADFFMWMGWWWACFFWFCTGRLVKKVWNFAYRKLGTMLTKMADAVFGNRFSELK